MFWVIDRPQLLGNDAIYGEKTGDQDAYKRETCKTCAHYTSVQQVRDLCIELRGTQLDHFVWIDGPELIINDKLHHLLKKSSLSGFEFRNVQILVWNGNVIPPDKLPKLFQIIVKGNGGSIFPQNKTHARSTCKNCGNTEWEPLDKIKVDLSQWDRSDIFYMTEFPGFAIISEEFYDFLIKNKIKGYRLVPSEEFSMKLF